MRYDNPQLQQQLAAEYILGTLRGQTKARYEGLKAKRADWQQQYDWVASQLHKLADTVPAVTPPNAVWQNIENRLFNTQKTSNYVVNWWRALGVGTSAIAAALAFVLVTQQPEAPPAFIAPPTQVALLAGDDAKPAFMLNLVKTDKGETAIRVSALNTLKAQPENALQLWMIPNGHKPISLGLLPQQGQKTLVVLETLAAELVQSGLAVSLEPIGGSPTGQPTGAVLYQGKLVVI